MISFFINFASNYYHNMNLSEIGAQIKSRRKFLKLSQQELADLAEVNINTIVSIERGAGNPLYQTINHVAEVLGLEIVMK